MNHFLTCLISHEMCDTRGLVASNSYFLALRHEAAAGRYRLDILFKDPSFFDRRVPASPTKTAADVLKLDQPKPGYWTFTPL